MANMSTDYQTFKSVLKKVGGPRKGELASLPKKPPKIPNDPNKPFPAEAKFPVNLHLNSMQAPFIEGWAVGKDYTLVIKVHLDSLETRTVDRDGKGEKQETDAFMTITDIAGL